MNRQQIIEKLQQYKKTVHRYPIAQLGIFGSFARGENNSNSDIDILVEFNNDIG